MPYKPKVGSDFPISEAAIDTRTKHLQEATRTKIALALLATFLVSLGCAFIISVVTWDFSYVRSLWMIVAAPFGALIAHYFGEKSGNDKNNNESAA